MHGNGLPRIVVIAGTTASGKSALAIDLARKYNGEIVSADSRQVYKGFDLCSGKVTEEERKLVPHHLLDICDIGEKYSVFDYQKAAYDTIAQISERGRVPFLVGGTGLYIASVVQGYVFRQEAFDPDLRRELEAKSLDKLWEMLPDDAKARLNASDKKNRRRIIRLLEKNQMGEERASRNQPQFFRPAARRYLAKRNSIPQDRRAAENKAGAGDDRGGAALFGVGEPYVTPRRCGSARQNASPTKIEYSRECY